MSRPSTGKVKVNIYFDERTLAALRRIGVARGVTYSELIREAARQYVLAESGKIAPEAAIFDQLGRTK